MSKLICPCGNQISDVAVPSADKSLMISDVDMDAVEGDHGVIDFSQFIQRTRDVWHCRECGRIAIEEKDRAVTWYRPVV